MLHNDSLPELERRAALYQGDGALDIAVGTGLLLAGVAMLLDLVAFSGIFLLIAFLLMPLFKRHVTAPRMDQVELRAIERAAQRARTMQAMLLAALTGLLFLGIFVFLLFAARPAWMTAALTSVGGMWGAIALVMAAMLVLLAWISQARRFLVYLLAVPPLWFGAYTLQLDLPIALALLGAGMVAGGSTVLARFLRRYPADKRGREI